MITLEFRNLIFTKKQLCTLLGKSLNAINHEINKGKFKVYKFGKGKNGAVYINGISLAIDLLKAHYKDTPDDTNLIISFTGIPDNEVALIKEELDMKKVWSKV